MKPDAHKKKASQAYKKKHGMATEKKPAAEAGRGGGRRGKDQASGGEWSSARETSNQEPGRTDAAPSTSVKLDDSQPDVQPFHFEGRTFKRRQVESNWDRYDGLAAGEDEDHVTQRGADFSLLLNVATNSLSQFRFSDEQDWDEALSESSSALSIDCVSVASTLRCLPLDVQLGISEEYFTADQLKLFKQSAKRHLDTYMEQRNSAKPCSQPESIDIGMWDDDTIDGEEEEEFLTSGNIDVQSDGSIEAKTFISKDTPVVKAQAISKEPAKCIEKNAQSGKNQSVQEVIINRSEPDVRSEEPQIDATEDDLDMLLGLDAPVKQSNEVEQEDLIAESPENPLPVQETQNESPDPPVNVPSSTTNLEDWLDDLLDD